MKNKYTKIITRSKNRLFSLSLICLLLPMISFAQSDFITRWEVVSSGTNTLIKFKKNASAQVNYSWTGGGTSGSGTFSAGLGTATISVPGPGTYYLNIEPQNFDRFYMDMTVSPEQLASVEQWGSASWTSTQNMFRECSNMDISASDIPDLSNVTTMSMMFLGCSSLSGIPNVHSWDVSGVLDMSSMFNGASSLPGGQANGGMGAWNTSLVTNMSYMFQFASAFNGDLSSWDIGNVTTTSAMFSGATAFDQNIGNWNTSSVQDMSYMFYGASSFNQDLNNWNLQSLTNASYMFESATSYNQPMSNWNVSEVMNMSSMFRNATNFSQDITSWDISSVWTMDYMFQNCPIDYDFGTWEINLVNADYMFDGSGMTCENYSSTLIGWRNQSGLPYSVSFIGQNGMEYGTNASVARDWLTNTISWTISDDTPSGVECTQSLGLDALESQITIYPNPATNYIAIEGVGSNATFTITDMNGNRLDVPKTNKGFAISNLESGVYFLHVEKEQRAVTHRFVKM